MAILFYQNIKKILKHCKFKVIKPVKKMLKIRKCEKQNIFTENSHHKNREFNRKF